MTKTNKTIKVEQSVLDDIQKSIGQYKVETGGILLARNDVICKFIFDEGGTCSHGAYDPDYKGLNIILKEEEAKGLTYVGSVHSHPRGIQYPSGDWGNNTGDHGAIKANLACNPNLDRFFALIAYSTYDGGPYALFSYMVFRDDVETIFESSIEVVESESRQTDAQSENKFTTARLEGGVDVDLMGKSKIVCVGIGGANQIIESLVRTNAHNLICIDFDVVDANNLITQGYYQSEIGLPKVEALGNRLKLINPDIKYWGINANLFDLSENELKGILTGADLLLMMTDSFDAQVRGNQLSLQYGVPTVFALMYYQGMACEITFNIPELLSVSHKDAVIERYAACYEKPVKAVTSTGGTIFQTQYLNSAIGMIALHLLHYKNPNQNYGGIFNENFNRNFIQLRLNKDYSSKPGNMFYEASQSNPGVTFFDAIWREVVPAEQNPEVDVEGKEWYMNS